MRSILFALTLLLCAGGVFAQSNPCDAMPTSATLTGKTGIVGFCHDQKDKNGDPTVLTSAIVRVNGTVVLTWTSPTGGLTPTVTTPSPLKGLYYFETVPMPLLKGSNQTVTYSVTDADGESVLSDPFQLNVKGPGPSKPGPHKVR